MNTDFLKNLMQMYNSSNEVTAIPVSEYHSLFKDMMRDEIQIILPKNKGDMFSEELRVMISNI